MVNTAKLMTNDSGTIFECLTLMNKTVEHTFNGAVMQAMKSKNQVGDVPLNGHRSTTY